MLCTSLEIKYVGPVGLGFFSQCFWLGRAGLRKKLWNRTGLFMSLALFSGRAWAFFTIFFGPCRAGLRIKLMYRTWPKMCGPRRSIVPIWYFLIIGICILWGISYYILKLFAHGKQFLQKCIEWEKKFGNFKCPWIVQKEYRYFENLILYGILSCKHLVKVSNIWGYSNRFWFTT